jgi:hypothetical protein
VDADVLTKLIAQLKGKQLHEVSLPYLLGHCCWKGKDHLCWTCCWLWRCGCHHHCRQGRGQEAC